MNIKHQVVAAFFVIASAGAAAGSDSPGAGLYAEYLLSNANQTGSVTVCGAAGGESGCFGTWFLKPFDRICAVMEGVPVQSGNTVKRAIYVLDARTSPTAPVTLTVFTRTDKYDGNGGVRSITVGKNRVLRLGFVGGPNAQCFMAASPGLVYAGTDTGGAARVDKTSFEVAAIVGNSGLKSITADDRGYVSVSTEFSNVIYGPDGGEVSEGGGHSDVVNSTNAWKP